MTTLNLSSDFGAQVQQLEADMMAGVYALADTYATELSEFGNLFDLGNPTVLQLASTQIRLSYASDNEDYVLTLSGSGLGPVSSLADLEAALDSGLATGAINTVTVKRVVSGLPDTTILSLTTSATGYTLTSGLDVFTVTGSLPASFEDLFDLSDLVAQLDMDILSAMTPAARTAYFAALSDFGITGLSVSSNGDTFASFELTPTTMTLMIGNLELEVVGTLPDDFGLMAKVAYDLFAQTNAGLPTDLSGISGLAISSVTLRDAGGNALYELTGPITDEWSTILDALYIDGLEWAPDANLENLPWDGFLGDFYGGDIGSIVFGSNNPVQSDLIYGGASADYILGLAGSDLLSGDFGDDRIYGGDGHDSLAGDHGNDTVDGGDGFDIVHYGQTPLNSYENKRVDLTKTTAQNTGEGKDLILNVEGVVSGSGDDWITGNDVANYLFSGYGNDRLVGNGGNDSLNGYFGNDTVFGDAGNDSVDGGDGNDVLRGGSENDTVNGGAGNDTLLGEAGNDRLVAGNGVDRLEGGTGRDVLAGGAHRDLFVFNALTDSANSAQRDTILDFVSGLDDIVLNVIDANTALTGNQAFAFGGTTAAANAVWYAAGAGFITVFADASGDGAADFSLQVNGLTSILATDFVL